jgi:hypothetical protein
MKVKRFTPSSQAQANSTLALTVASNTCQIFTGNTAGQKVTLPVATTLTNGWVFEIHNNGTQDVTIYLADGTTAVEVLKTTSYGVFVLLNNTTSNGVWTNHQSGATIFSADATAELTTSSATFVDLTGMSYTPVVSGWYDCDFGANAGNTNNGAGAGFTFSVNAVDDTNLEKNAYTSGGVLGFVSIRRFYYILAGQIIQVRWRRTANTARVTNRTLTIQKIG